jgi:hypothetical protein
VCRFEFHGWEIFFFFFFCNSDRFKSINVTSNDQKNFAGVSVNTKYQVLL